MEKVILENQNGKNYRGAPTGFQCETESQRLTNFSFILSHEGLLDEEQLSSCGAAGAGAEACDPHGL